MTLLSRACVSISLKLCLYVEPFIRYSASKNGVLETGGRGRSRSVKMAPFDRLYDFLLVGHCKHSCMLYDIEKVTEGHSNWYHAKDLVRFPIRLS